MRPAPRMFTLRSLPALVVASALVLGVAACASDAGPGWTFAPLPSGSAPVPGSPGAGSPGVGTPAPGSPGTSAPVGTPNASGSAPASQPTGSGTVGDTLQISAQNIQFSTDALQAPAGQAFIIEFENRDAGIPHNVEIKDQSGGSLFVGDVFNGVAARTYQVPAIGGGTYTFICTVHPNMKGTLTAA